MSKNEMQKPVIPYFMNTPYYSAYDLSCRHRGIGGIGSMPYGGRGYYGHYGCYGQYGLPYNQGVRRDAYKTLEMQGNRRTHYNEFLKRWETQLSDVRTVTVERDNKTKKLKKYVHTPYVMSEQYITKLEWTFIKWRVLGILSALILITVITVFVLNMLDVI